MRTPYGCGRGFGVRGALCNGDFPGYDYAREWDTAAGAAAFTVDHTDGAHVRAEHARIRHDR